MFTCGSFSHFWGSASSAGSLQHLKEIVCRHQVERKGKIFSVGDEFIQQCFKAHLRANICQQFNIISTSQPIPHEPTKEWLETTAEKLLAHSIMPTDSADPVYFMHRSFLYTGFLYMDLREAIPYEEGTHY